MAGEQFYTSRYAMIKNGVVENIALFDSAATAQRIGTELGFEVVCTDLYFVTIGDTYVDGVFYHDGDEIERQLTIEEKVNDYASRINDLELLLLQMEGVL